MVEFVEWPKSPRLNREAVVTEKIDGTNAAVIIEEDGTVTAQSRKRLIYPGKSTDNAGFAAWVDECKEALSDILGPGRHFGEWWGKGIQRAYNMDHKVFSLFNTSRWGDWEDISDPLNPVPNPHALSDEDFNPLWPELQCVPVIDSGPFADMVEMVPGFLGELRDNGSYASPFYERPEGIMIFHTAANLSFKVTLENDEIPKSAL